MLSPDLTAAFQFYMRDARHRPAFYYAQGYNGRNAWPERAYGIAKRALELARADVAAGKKRYAPRLPLDGRNGGDAAEGLRFVGYVMPDCGRRNGYWHEGDYGWYTDPYGDVFRDGTGLCYGAVYQLTGRNGESRFIAGYQFGGCDGGPDLDLSRVFTDPRGDYAARPRDLDAARDAARYADELARVAAEKEREYQTAWRAGSCYATEGEAIDAARAELRDILKERRAVKGRGEYPTLCAAIRSQVQSLLSTVREARDRQDELAAGIADDLWFHTGEQRLMEAFCEGAELNLLQYPSRQLSR